MLPGGPQWRAIDIHMPEAPNESLLLLYRDPVECLKFLEGNPAYQGHVSFVPVEEFDDAEMTSRLYSEVHTGRMMAELQKLVPAGVTVNPMILGSDATHVTNFSGDGKMHPVYVSSGHFHKGIRNQPSRRLFMLVAYIPVCKFAKTEFATAQQQKIMPGRLQARLFHKCMSIIFDSVKRAGSTPVEMIDPYGFVRLHMVFPVIYIADKEEQSLNACLNKNWCTACLAETHDLDSETPCAPRTGQSILALIRSVRMQNPDANTWQFIQACLKMGLSGVEEPWWADMPHIDICRVLCNDPLHTLHKGFKDHMWSWTVNMIGEDEIDRRFRRLPKVHGYRTFTGGISKISQWSIKDARDIERYALSVAMGAVPNRAIAALRAELDYIYTAQWKSVPESELAHLAEYTEIYHKNRGIFIEPGGGRTGKGGDIIPHFRIPKIHARLHFPDHIRDIGSLENCSAQITERYHRDVVKQAYAASNRKNVGPQMVGWLNRLEKVYNEDDLLAWLDPSLAEEGHNAEGEESDDEESAETIPLATHRGAHHLTKKPSLQRKSITEVAAIFDLPDLLERLSYYVAKSQNMSDANARTAVLPAAWRTLDVWFRTQVLLPDLDDKGKPRKESILARPYTTKEKIGRYHTVLYDTDPNSTSTQHGIEGEFICPYCISN